MPIKKQCKPERPLAEVAHPRKTSERCDFARQNPQNNNPRDTSTHHKKTGAEREQKRSNEGHGRRHNGFAPDTEENDGLWERDPAKLPQSGFSVQVAARGFLKPLLEELGDRTITVYGRLVLVHSKEPAHWAQTAWLNPEWLSIQSIRDGANRLASIQRNWKAHYSQDGGLARRTALIETELPHVSCRPLRFGESLPTAPLGAFTLWEKDLLLAASRTTSPFPDGEINFEENKIDPPGRAYLKLWESFTRLGKHPQPGELCLDLGAAPGSWTWVLAGLGCRIFSIDKALLASPLLHLPNVNHCLGSGFGLTPQDTGQVDWLFSDMICYPAKLLTFIQKWIKAKAMRRALCTLKFQAETDHATAAEFARIPGSKLMHLSCNKHELTWFWQAD